MSTTKSSRNNMPKKNTIAEYWNPILIRIGLEVDYELQNNIQCFTCGKTDQRLERAHIKAKCNGGSDSVKNLHVLCRGCHDESEFYEGDIYWRWYKYKRVNEFNEIFKNDIARYISINPQA